VIEKMAGKFYVTTPIYYVNAEPHIGHIYTTIIADILARFNRLNGKDVFFLTGTDENSQKNVEAAKKAGQDVAKFVDKMAAIWKSEFKQLGFSFDDFIRTTEERHKKGVEEFFKRVNKKGDIYKGKYVGYYCVGCEAFVTKSDLVDGKCPIHKTEPEIIEEENYFFKASKYKDQILEHIEKNPDFIQPKERRNEVIEYVKNFFTDVSISRQKQKWGIPVPIDKKQVFYVWFDALINYLTGIGFGWDYKKFERYWPADLHLIGKDITKFHCALWPAMLFSAEIELPRKIFILGFFTVNGEKISKSLGNAIDPVELSKKYSLDALKYCLIREKPLGEDGDFSEKRLIERNNGELVANIGNFIHRTLTFIYSNFNAKVPKPANLTEEDEEFKKEIERIAVLVGNQIENIELDKALKSILDFSSVCNQYFQKKEPWVKKSEAPTTLYLSVNAVRCLAILLEPFLPSSAEKIWKLLGYDDSVHGQDWLSASKLMLQPGWQIRKPEIIFKIIEAKE
jgi:methionyl-tRNA synthetase